MNGTRRAFSATLPVMAGYMVLGMGFGMLMNSRGYGIWLPVAMSLFIYAGSMQYAAIDLLSGGAGVLTCALTTLLVNARHLFYGITMIDAYRDTGKYKPYLMLTLTDETYSLLCNDTAPDDGTGKTRYRLLVSLFDHAWWVLGTAIGAVIGQLLPFDPVGIDFALTALFLTILVDNLRERASRRPAIMGLGMSAVCLVILGPDSFLLPAMAGTVCLLLLTRRGVRA